MPPRTHVACTGVWRAADLAWELSRLPGPKWVGQSPSTPLPLLPEGPSHLLLLIPQAPFLCPQGPTQPGWGMEGRGSAWVLNRLPGPEWAGQTPSTPLLLLPQPPAPLDLPSLPPMPPEPTWPGWGFGWGRTGLGAHQPPQPQWARRSPSTPLLVFPESPSHLPLLISPASGAPTLSGLHFSSLLGPPASYQFTLGLLPSPWGLESPTSGRQAP